MGAGLIIFNQPSRQGIDSQNCPDDLGNWAIEEFRWDIKKQCPFGDVLRLLDCQDRRKGDQEDWPATWQNGAGRPQSKTREVIIS